MHPDELKRLLHATPFRPFTVFMPSEKSFSIPHHDFAWLTPSGKTLIVGAAEREGVDMLSVGMITRIEAQEAPRDK